MENIQTERTVQLDIADELAQVVEAAFSQQLSVEPKDTLLSLAYSTDP